MPGPAPKDPSVRLRRNVPTAGEWIVLPPEPFKGPKPRSPRLSSVHARDSWGSWWKSPMAHMWSEADWPGLIRLIALIDSYTEFGDLDSLKEIRLQEDRFGLSPKGRQSLRWRLPDTDEVPVAKAGGRKLSASSMRDRLTLVAN